MCGVSVHVCGVVVDNMSVHVWTTLAVPLAVVVKYPSVDRAGSAGGNGVHRAPHLEKATVCFGDTAQDVLSTLGAPGKVFYKAEDKVGGTLPSNGAPCALSPPSAADEDPSKEGAEATRLRVL